MDIYYNYNQIKMDPLDTHKTMFMCNHGNYYYNAIPFGLNNIDTAYQRLMDTVFSD